MKHHGATTETLRLGSKTGLGDTGDGELLSNTEQKKKNSETGILEGDFNSWVESGGKEPRGRVGVQGDCNSQDRR